MASVNKKITSYYMFFYFRFKNSAVQDSIKQFVMKTVSEYFVQKKSVDNMTRNFVKFLGTSCGYLEIRQLAVAKLDPFLNSTKLSRPAQDLLSFISANARTGSSGDTEVIQKLSQLRIKSKPMANFYISCMRELMGLHPHNLEHMMKTVIRNELANNRNTTNMQFIAAFFQHDGEKSAIVLAHIFQELLLQPEDCLRSLRILLREIVRCVHYEFKFSQFALALMQEITLPSFRNTDAKIQERMFLSLNSLICLTILLSCKPSIKEIAMSSTKTDVLPLIKFQNEVAAMQKNAVWWLHKIVPAQYRIMAKHYYNSLRQVLFLDDPINYTSKDNWPSDAERDMLVSLCANVPLLENTLMRLGVLGTVNNLPLKPQEVLLIINSVVRRAAMLDTDNDVPPPLQITGQTKHNLDIIQMLIKLSEYKYHNIKLPEGYSPPQLVVSSHYWRAWQILLVLAAFNPTTVGVLAWERHPTLRGFMEMVITNNYQFPLNSMKYQETMMLEKQLSAAEETDILVFEGHIARGVKITKQNSHLLNQLMVVKEGGPMRKPPQAVLDQTRLLAMELHLGHKLCKVRDPDFLLDIIKQQGTSRSMSWLSELVKNSENSFELLPVPCLCEFLLQDIQNTKRHILLKRLQSILLGTSDSIQTQEIVSYFISKMSASYVIRYKALKGLKTIFNRPLENQTNEDWLLVDLANIPLHSRVSSIISTELLKALLVEQSVSLLGAYLVYICRYSSKSSMVSAGHEIASVIMKRNHVMFTVLEANENALIALLDLFLQTLVSHKGTKKGEQGVVGITVDGKQKYFDKEIIQANLVLLAEARGRDVGNNDSVTKLKKILFSTGTLGQLHDNMESLCSENLVPILLGSGVQELQDLAVKNLSYENMLHLLQEFSLPETAAQYILDKLDKNIKEVEPFLAEQEELLSHIQAWRINVSAGEEVESILMKNSTKEETKTVNYYARFASPEKMETDEVIEEKPKEWSQILREIFENDSVESQSHLMTYCLQNKHMEEICLNLFLWIQDNKLPATHEQFVTVVVQILAENCSNRDLLEKLLTAISPICKSLLPLHRQLFPGSCVPAEDDDSKIGSLLSWCSNPEIMEFKTVIDTLKSINVGTAVDKKTLGSVWQKVFKTAICNNGKHGINIEHLVELVIDKMIESSSCSGMFMDWLQVLSPELSCFKIFLGRNEMVPVSLQRYILNMICSSCGWDTLHECINCFLSTEVTGFSDSLILDFLQGCCNNERIWQGANSKRGTSKGSLKLNSEQLWRLCTLIMSEISHFDKQQDKQFVLLSWRLPLILSPFHKPLFPDLVSRLQHYPNKCSKLLTLSLYLAEPTAFSHGTSSNLINGALACTAISTSCDALIHQLINNVCDNKKNSASGYVLLRRLAAYHPPLILRHLDLMTDALGSPTSLSKSEFMKANHGAIFISIIGILEALGSHLFKRDASAILKECIAFAILHTKAETRLYTPTIIKLSQILLLNLENDRAGALKLLDKDIVEKLKKIENKIRDPVLTKLLNCLVNGDNSFSADFDESSMAPYLAKMSTDSPETLSILQDLDAGSIKKPAVLKMFLHEICRRMTSDSAECRTLAHKLAIRHVRQVPKDSSTVFSYIEAALQSPHHDVIKSVVAEIPELILLSGPESARLMRLVFSAVANSNIDITNEFMVIMKTIVTSSDLF